MLNAYLDIQPQSRRCLVAGKPVVAGIHHHLPRYARITERGDGAPGRAGGARQRRRAGHHRHHRWPPQNWVWMGALRRWAGWPRRPDQSAADRDIPFVLAKQGAGRDDCSFHHDHCRHGGDPVFATGGIGSVPAAPRRPSRAFLRSAGVRSEPGSRGLRRCQVDPRHRLRPWSIWRPRGAVIGYQTEELPAFYTRESGFKVITASTPRRAIAEALRLKWELGRPRWRGHQPHPDRSLPCPRQTSTPPLPRHCVRGGRAGVRARVHSFLLAWV